MRSCECGVSGLRVRSHGAASAQSQGRASGASMASMTSMASTTSMTSMASISSTTRKTRKTSTTRKISISNGFFIVLTNFQVVKSPMKWLFFIKNVFTNIF